MDNITLARVVVLSMLGFAIIYEIASMPWPEANSSDEAPQFAIDSGMASCTGTMMFPSLSCNSNFNITVLTAEALAEAANTSYNLVTIGRSCTGESVGIEIRFYLETSSVVADTFVESLIADPVATLGPNYTYDPCCVEAEVMLNENTESGNDDDLSNSELAGIIVACICVLALLIAAATWCVYKKHLKAVKEKKRIEEIQSLGMMTSVDVEGKFEGKQRQERKHKLPLPAGAKPGQNSKQEDHRLNDLGSDQGSGVIASAPPNEISIADRYSMPPRWKAGVFGLDPKKPEGKIDTKKSSGTIVHAPEDFKIRLIKWNSKIDIHRNEQEIKNALSQHNFLPVSIRPEAPKRNRHLFFQKDKANLPPLTSTARLDDLKKISLEGKDIKFAKLLEEANIASGEFGAVYSVQNIHDKKLYAIKIISKSSFPKPNQAAKEAQTLANLAPHPHIVELYKTWTWCGQLFLVLEYCPASLLEDLKERRRASSNWAKTTAEIVLAIAEGIAHLHSNGVTHGRLKLGTIFVGIDNEIKIGDPGISISTGSQAQPILQIPETPSTKSDSRQGAIYKAPEEKDVDGMHTILHGSL